MPNPYYNPEKLGLTILQEYDDAPAYEFNISMLWKHDETGDYYFGSDSGCSCPSPFEDFTSLADLERITLQNIDGFYSVTEGVDSSWWDTLDGIKHVLTKRDRGLKG